MKRIKTLLLIVMISLAVFAAGFAFVSVHVYHRSIGASLMELRLQSKNSTRVFETAQNAQKYMQRRAKSEDKWYELPKDVSFEGTMIVFHYRNIKLLAFVPESEKKHIVLVSARRRICEPDFQKSAALLRPAGTAVGFCRAGTHLSVGAQSSVQRNISGAGTPVSGHSRVHGFAADDFGRFRGRRTCRRILRVSRRVGLGTAGAFDLSFARGWMPRCSNPDIKRYAKHDPTLSPKGLRRMGKAWAGPYTNAKDYRISPMFGELSYFRDVTLFTGTRELLYPDVVKFSELLQEAGAETTLHVGNGLNHNYPLYDILEAGEAMRQICEAIER